MLRHRMRGAGACKAGQNGLTGAKLRVWTPREMQAVFYGSMRDVVEFQRVSGLMMQQLRLRALMDIRRSVPNRNCAHHDAYSFPGFSDPVILDCSPIILHLEPPHPMLQPDCIRQPVEFGNLVPSASLPRPFGQACWRGRRQQVISAFVSASGLTRSQPRHRLSSQLIE